jgi:RecB family endonuclease NucS
MVPGSKDQPDGEKGRRIFVRWDFTIGPDNRDLVIALPPESRLTPGALRPTIAEIYSQTYERLREAMNDQANWVGLVSEFSYERSLSDYISAYPYRLEDGLLPHPNKKVRERIFSDSKRLDVLLEDKNGKAVIVECKQNQPTVRDIEQLQHYLNKFKEEEEQEARGILVHGGARKLREEVRQAAKKKPIVELVQFSVGVDFSKSE